MTMGRFRAISARARKFGTGGVSNIIANPVAAVTTVASLPIGANELVLLEANSLSHFIEFDVGYVPTISIRYVDANNQTKLNQATYQVGRTNFSANLITAGSDSPNYPSFINPLPNSVTVATGDRWYLLDDPTGKWSYALKRLNQGTGEYDIIFQTALFSSGSVAQTSKIAILGRATGGALNNVKYGPIDNAMRLTSAGIDSLFKPVVSLQYTGSPIAYRIAVMKADGVTPVIAASTPTIVANSQGIIDLKLDIAIPKSEFGTTPLIVVTQVDGSGNAVNDTAGQPLRRSQTVTMPAGAQRINVNLDYIQRGTNTRALLNLAKIAPFFPVAGGSAAAIGSDIDAYGNFLRMPTAGGRWRHQIMFPTDGKVWTGSTWKSRIRARWKGTMSVYPDGSFTNQQAGSDGTFTWIDADYSFADPSAAFYAIFEFDGLGSGSSAPTDFHLAEIDGSGNYRYDPALTWHPQQVLDLKQFHDRPRVMDPSKVDGNNSLVVTLANRTPANGYQYGADGAGIETLCKLSTQLGKALDWVFPLQADEAYIRFMTGYLLTHAATLPGNASHSMGYTNEPWNSAHGAWGTFASIGATRGYAGTQNDQALKAFAVENERVMGIITDEATIRGKVANGKIIGIKRLINCQNNSNTSGIRAQLNNESVSALALTDIISCAPYFGNQIADAKSSTGRTGTSDPLILAERARADIPGVVSNAKVIRDYAIANGKEFDMYEGGTEVFSAGSQPAADFNFRRHPISGTVMTEYLQALETSVGGPATLHIYTLERSGGSGGFGHGYGLREFMGQSRTVTGPDGVPPAYKYDAVLTKIEALNAAA